MSHHPTDPQRWSDATGRSGTIEELAGASLRRARQASEPSDAALARAARRLDQPAPRSRVALLVWRVALVLVLLVATGGVVGAALYRWWGGGDTAAPAPAAAPQSSRGAARPAHARRRGPQEAIAGPEAEGELPVAATPEPPPEQPPLPLAPAEATDLRPVAEPAPAPPRPARARAPFDEGNDLTRVFHALRAGGDPAAALRALDQHDLRFPHGVLATEARLARAEALVALGRRAEALPLLTGIEEGGDALTPEARVTRGELLADVHRCAEAERDFDVVIGVAAAAAAGVRALYGRARCRQAAGDVAAARRALEQLLSGHPDDRYAPQTANTGVAATQIAVGDLNGDGRLDLVFTDTYGPFFHTAFARNGGFTAPVQNSVFPMVADGGGQSSLSIVLADIDGDGDLDLAGGGLCCGVGFALNDGRGLFGPGQPVARPGGAGWPIVSSIQTGDFDGDGKPDLVVVDAVEVSIVLNTSH